MTTLPNPYQGDSALSEEEQELMQSYIWWREAAAEAADAYSRWADAPADLRAGRFLEYRAALDEEEFAAFCYALAVTNGSATV